MSKPEKKAVGADLRRVQDGERGMPLVRDMGQQVKEVRSITPRGRIRIFFTDLVTRPVSVLLYALFERSQKTPKPDLDLAWQRAREVHHKDQKGVWR